jgi:hypothetical protein
MESYIGKIVPIRPHTEGGMASGLLSRPVCRNATRRHKHRSLLAAIENGHALIAVQGPEHVGHATAKIEN